LSPGTRYASPPRPPGSNPLTRGDDMAQLKIPLDAQRFEKGMRWKDYMAQMGDTRARTEENYAKSKLTDDERKFFSGINQVRFVLMLAENWCGDRSEEHTSELQSRFDLVCRLLLEKKKKNKKM